MAEIPTVTLTVATGQKPFYKREKFWLGVVIALVPAVNEATGMNLSPATILQIVGVLAGVLGMKMLASAAAHVQDKKAEVERAKNGNAGGATS